MCIVKKQLILAGNNSVSRRRAWVNLLFGS
jgi:hypothetical protein